MLTIKKLIFAPLFLIFFVILLSQLSPVFKSYDFIFSLSINTLITLVTISVLIMLTSFSFTLFATFAFDWKLILGIGVLAALVPLLFFDVSAGLVFGVGIFASLMLIYVTLENNLKSYLTFQPNTLLAPSIRHLSSFLILVLTLVYFLAVNKIISEKGFEIPDALLDSAINFTSQGQSAPQTPTSQPTLSQDQIDLLRKNPDLLRQSGLDPAILDTLSKPQKTIQDATNDLIKQTIKDQFQNLLKPYLGFIPAVLALFLFLTLQGLTSFINLLIYPLIWITFYILEKTGFVKFVVEQRPVKKMVI